MPQSTWLTSGQTALIGLVAVIASAAASTQHATPEACQTRVTAGLEFCPMGRRMPSVSGQQND